MTAAGLLVFPAGRVLAGWWQQLAPMRPQALWVGHLLLHGVEALACVRRPRPLDRFTRLVLRALMLGRERTVAVVEGHLHLGAQAVRQVLHQLRGEGLVQAGPADEWQPTALGRYAFDHGEYPSAGLERRKFHFLESGQSGSGPSFLNILVCCTPWPAPESWRFDVGALHACLHQPPEWKQRRGFPADVADILLSRPESASGHPPAHSAAAAGLPDPTPLPEPPEWQRVIVDRPEHLPAALVRVPGGPDGDRLLGFPVREDGWVLQTDRPAFALGADWPEVFPALAEGPPPEVWRQAWRTWCQARRLPPAEAEACALKPSGHRLRVAAERRLLDRLRALRSDALRGEAWLLAGEGRVQPAALLEVVEKPR